MEETEAFKPLLTSLGELQITTTTMVININCPEEGQGYEDNDQFFTAVPNEEVSNAVKA